MGPWQRINEGTPPANCLILFHMPESMYMWASGREFEDVKKEHPDITHYCVAVEAPTK